MLFFFDFATFRHFRQSTGCSDGFFTYLPFSLNPFLNKRNTTPTMSIIPGPLLQPLHPSYRFFSEACALCTFWAPVSLMFFSRKGKIPLKDQYPVSGPCHTSYFQQSTGCSDVFFTSLPFSLIPFLVKRNTTPTMSIIPGPLLQPLHPSYRFFSEACALCTFWAPVNLVFFHGKTKFL